MKAYYLHDFSTMDPAPCKPEPTAPDADTLLRLVDLELEQKRAERKRAAARHRSARTLSIFLLLMVIAGVFLAFFFLFSQVQNRPQAAHGGNAPHQSGR